MTTATMMSLSLNLRAPSGAAREPQYELRFPALREDGCAYAFPCDASGRVDIDALSEKAREMYFYARWVVGRVFSRPTVHPSHLH